MADTVLATVLRQQFEDAFGILAGGIETFSEPEWRTGQAPFDGPARAVAHVLQCAEFYTHSDGSVFSNLGKRVWEMTAEELPSQSAMSTYLKRVRELTGAWIDDISQTGFDQPSGEDDTIGLDRVVYALRHLQHHTGEVCCWQKQFGHAQDQWT